MYFILQYIDDEIIDEADVREGWLTRFARIRGGQRKIDRLQYGVYMDTSVIYKIQKPLIHSHRMISVPAYEYRFIWNCELKSLIIYV